MRLCPYCHNPISDAVVDQLQAENDKLRDKCDTYSEIIEYMVHPDLYEQVKAENEKLREQGERLFDKTLELGTENARLRKLLRVMAYCMQQGRDCDGCAVNGAAGVVTAPSGCDWLRDRMRELGVEV